MRENVRGGYLGEERRTSAAPLMYCAWPAIRPGFSMLLLPEGWAAMMLVVYVCMACGLSVEDCAAIKSFSRWTGSACLSVFVVSWVKLRIWRRLGIADVTLRLHRLPR